MDTEAITERIKALAMQVDVDGEPLTNDEYRECSRYFHIFNGHIALLAHIAAYGNKAVKARRDGNIREAQAWEAEKDIVMKVLRASAPQHTW